MKKVGHTAEKHNEIIWWTHHRALLHKAILKTRETAFAYDLGHFGKGIFAYNSKDGGYIEDSFRIRHNTRWCSWKRNWEIIEGTKIYADVGFSKTHDRIPGSRTIFLKLEENDEVSVKQEYQTDIQDYQISFLHLKGHFQTLL